MKDRDSQGFRLANALSYSWTVTPSPTATNTAYGFYVYADIVDPSYGPYARRDAFPLRCLSTTAVGTGRKTAKSAFPNTTKK